MIPELIAISVGAGIAVFGLVVFHFWGKRLEQDDSRFRTPIDRVNARIDWLEQQTGERFDRLCDRLENRMSSLEQRQAWLEGVRHGLTVEERTGSRAGWR